MLPRRCGPLVEYLHETHHDQFYGLTGSSMSLKAGLAPAWQSFLMHEFSD